MVLDNSPPATLLDLPNELLLVISEQLDDDGLLNLAAICKRVNLLLIPGIFARFGFELPAPFCGSLPFLSFSGENLDLLRAIGIAYFVNSIEAIDCAFFAYNRYISPKETFGACSALNTLAIRLAHLGHLRFNPYVTGHTTHELFGWSDAMAVLLNSAAGRGDCAITVCSGPKDDYVADPRPFSHAFQVRVSGNATPSQSGTTLLQRLRRALASVFRLSRGSHSLPRTSALAVLSSPSEPESIERPSGVKIPFLSQSALTTLNIHSSFLLHANFYRWTLHTLNTSPLTTLSLDNIDLSHYDWTLTLPALTLPALTTFEIGQCAITVPDLDLFLVRHPTIRTLDLPFHPAIGALSPPAAVCLLPHLASISATPDYLLYFLSDAEAAEWYPDLRAVGVTSNDESAYQVGQFRRLLKCIEERPVRPRVGMAGKLANCCHVPAHLAFAR
ncbi:hypothetical protein B0H19DRAFT_1193534 [Mycena capillaripes]|nr:hypothetical protein B0H19DRAFT_1193534 [Mycena capillaripes]